MNMDLAALAEPIVQAPMAGGVSTPMLAAAVNAAGGLGFLAAGYKTADAVSDDIRALHALTDRPFGVNIFASPRPPAAGPGGVAEAEVAAYAAQLAPEAERYHVRLGEPRSDDDDLQAKVALVARERVPVVSATFGCLDPAAMNSLHDAGCDVWITVTSPQEAVVAQQAGADALVVQGMEAGGHRGYFNDDSAVEDLGLIVALRLIANRVDLPLIAAGGIADGRAVAAVLCAGAVAAQVGSALMLSTEAATSTAHRAALAGFGATRLTRAFSGRTARGIVNRFMTEHDAAAPAAYPDVHHLTAPIRSAARAAGDPEAINLWAGQAHALAQAGPAAQIVRRLGAEARAAVREAALRLEPPQ